MTYGASMTSASITPLRYPLTTHICVSCRTRYAMHQDVLCGACAEEAEEPNASTRCVSCGAINGQWQKRPNGHTTRIQILGNGYCRKCWDIRKEAVR